MQNFITISLVPFVTSELKLGGPDKGPVQRKRLKGNTKIVNKQKVIVLQRFVTDDSAEA